MTTPHGHEPGASGMTRHCRPNAQISKAAFTFRLLEIKRVLALLFSDYSTRLVERTSGEKLQKLLFVHVPCLYYAFVASLSSAFWVAKSAWTL